MDSLLASLQKGWSFILEEGGSGREWGGARGSHKRMKEGPEGRGRGVEEKE